VVCGAVVGYIVLYRTSIVMEDNITNHNNTNHSYRTSIVMEDNVTNHNNTNHSYRTSIVMEVVILFSITIEVL
jgi:hypothetical protein